MAFLLDERLLKSETSFNVLLRERHFYLRLAAMWDRPSACPALQAPTPPVE
jgi:hypothetical protein